MDLESSEFWKGTETGEGRMNGHKLGLVSLSPSHISQLISRVLPFELDGH